MNTAASDDLQTLIARVALGDGAAFRHLYELCAPRMLGVALRILVRRDRAEDAVQEAFVKVWQRASDYSATAGSPLAWLTAIVRHQALDLLRSDKRRHTESTDDDDEDGPGRLDPPDERPDPLGLLEQAIDGLRLRVCFDVVPEQQRRCLALAYYHGLTHSELAEHIAAPIGSVKVWLRRGLDRLRRCLEAAP
ncbi:RNA polymerase sigma factor [Plasticicumulans sp.]|uniref:RNA polymerase sigma factor n=1 Tax=Plasticicumulans sp. TaxID=2307179 RepID=UPI002BBFCD30|nr:sigma-70 family RNA polymerase sigma factor [Plasticicumulans sp.]MBS0603175.1 sigma-70 family RNA polymerase sigma factor [Pseudomonadota bacterium]HMV39263.1 sigma-70 family RNA polymerase sigma factor [Plasticicumulans sp.]HMW29521.1 sigma-70 family RNA polymerase sigma factor [Plasticicumulans sp.]HMW43156.1 sigma-70 family RNA polymerase sigma factor [Plasticicumulans sp.]HMX54791.1 sigma-70 family RNA polymerase sigma factor [Plasticicumulans sp.]